MGSAEACCERVGSTLKYLWSDLQVRAPKNKLMDNVLLSDAQVSCLGNERDELLCANVVDVLLQAGSAPLVQRRTAKRRRSQQLSGSLTLKRLRLAVQARLTTSGRSAFMGWGMLVSCWAAAPRRAPQSNHRRGPPSCRRASARLQSRSGRHCGCCAEGRGRSRRLQ